MALDRAVRTGTPRADMTAVGPMPWRAADAEARLLPQPAYSWDFTQVRVHSDPSVLRRSCGQAKIGRVSGCLSRSGDAGGQLIRFKVGCDEFAPGEEAKLRAFARGVAPGERVTIDGFASEEGDPDFNRNLSCARANKAAMILTAEGVTAAQIGTRYMHGATPGPRPARRSVVLTKSTAPSPVPTPAGPRPATSTPPAPMPTPVPTVDCTTSQAEELARARPVAVTMVRKAIRLLGLSPAAPETPQVNALLRKYFGDDSASTYLHVLSGFRDIQRGLGAGVTHECENPGSVLYGHFCGQASAYVRLPLIARNIHVCHSAFGHGDVTLARILVHETSHLFGWTDDEQYCSPSSGCSLDRWDAYDNADSYARFAEELHRIFP